MKKKIIIIAIGVCVVIGSIIVINKNDNIFIIKVRKNNETETSRIVKISEGSEQYHNMGETIYDYDVTYSSKGDIISKEKLTGYTINQAKIYDNPHEADINKDDIIESDYYWQLAQDTPKFIKSDVIENSKIIILDTSIQAINNGVHNITNLALTYKNDNDELLQIGNPIYFSNSKDHNQKVYEYALLNGQSINTKVAWLLDEKVIGIDKLDLDRLYVSTNYSGDLKNQEFIKIDVSK